MEVLLKLLKNDLFITWTDEETDNRLKRIITNAILTMNFKLGAEVDYTIPGMAQNLFLTYCVYAYNGCINDFEENYLNDILQLRSFYATNTVEVEDGLGYASKEDIPTKLSELENDTNFITEENLIGIADKDYVQSEILRAQNNNLVALSIENNQLYLTTDKYQTVDMVDNVEILLPTIETINTFTEIHLFFSTTSDLTLTIPQGKYQMFPTISAGKTYEFIFTYVNEWLIGFVEYGVQED